MTTLAPVTTQLLSGRGSQSRLQVLIYHRVLKAQDPYQSAEATETEFDWQMRLMSRFFNVLPLQEALRQLHEGSLPPGSACITFDDGYLDNLLSAAPILSRYNLPATFFVSSGFTTEGALFADTVRECIRATDKTVVSLDIGDGQHEFSLQDQEQKLAAIAAVTQQIKYLPIDERSVALERLCSNTTVAPTTGLMMNPDQLRELSALPGLDIGAHTVDHPILSVEATTSAQWQIQKSKTHLEEWLDKEVKLFAYPNGKPGADYTEVHRDMVAKAGFDGAVSTRWGITSQGDDLFQVRRFTPWDQTPSRFLLRLMLNYRKAQA